MDVINLIVHVKDKLETYLLKDWLKNAASTIWENQVGNHSSNLKLTYKM